LAVPWLREGGLRAGRKFLPPPYYSQRAVFASPLGAFFIHQVSDYDVCNCSRCQKHMFHIHIHFRVRTDIVILLFPLLVSA